MTSGAEYINMREERWRSEERIDLRALGPNLGERRGRAERRRRKEIEKSRKGGRGRGKEERGVATGGGGDLSLSPITPFLLPPQLSPPHPLGYAPDAPSTFEKKEQLDIDVGKWRSGKGNLFFHPSPKPILGERGGGAGPFDSNCHRKRGR